MSIKIRKWNLIVVGMAILVLASCKVLGATGEISQANQRHILERISFGVNSEQIEQVQKQGIEAYLQSQLNPKQTTPKLKDDLNADKRSPLETTPTASSRQ